MIRATRDDRREEHGPRTQGADPAQRPGAAGEHQPPEVREQAAQVVARGPVALAAHLDRAGGDPAGDPGDGDVEVDAGAGVRGDRAGHLAEHEAVAVEVAGVRALGERSTSHFAPREAVLRSAPCGGSLVGRA